MKTLEVGKLKVKNISNNLEHGGCCLLGTDVGIQIYVILWVAILIPKTTSALLKTRLPRNILSIGSA